MVAAVGAPGYRARGRGLAGANGGSLMPPPTLLPKDREEDPLWAYVLVGLVIMLLGVLLGMVI